ncbi:vWA domain-containing protein [Calderihabitans maritimus]|uniref:VWA containing CoxE family protein n=1 Tax=Calderihabitans maritimus TaxID=1246530 RepID=A0A1Z5HUL3_9FIRM|nr:VWA domain-containing protein [Calderihabitans maritimus]GAW93015.1 VWA containing CoxE family protein [Calderihabitans maritimus]
MANKEIIPDYLENNLVKFVHLLRQAGIRVSSAEAIDALRAMGNINIMERKAVHAALRATLIKNVEDVPAFDKCFEVFFAAPEERKQRQTEWRQKQQEREELIRQAEEELTFRGEKLDLTEEDKLLYVQLKPVDKKRLQDFLYKSSTGKNVEKKNFKPIIENLVRGHLNYWDKRLRQRKELLQLEPTGDGEIDPMLYCISADLDGRENHILYEDMQNIREQDLPKVERIILRLSKRLATKISRRYRLSRKQERLDLRRTIRHNLGYGGTLLELKYKSRKVQKPKLILICDVSGSMGRYSNFVLQFIYGLSSVTSKIESFVFSEDLERITEYFQNGNTFASTMKQVVDESKVWGEGTDLARALETFIAGYSNLLDLKTVIIIVSDTKTLNVEKTGERLGKLRRRVKDILWFNTLPEQEWSKYRSVKVFQAYCKMYQCNTLKDLEKIINQEFLL